MLRPLSSFVHSIISAVIPPREYERVVSSLTLGDLERLRTEEGLPYHDRAVTALVWECKYNKNPRALALAGEYVAEELLGIAQEELGTPLLIPIPMHKARRRERGHNQTELLCESVLSYMKVPGNGDVFEYAPRALLRIQNTPPQQGLPRRRRLENLKGSMRADGGLVRGRVCIVVDDVSTTGATCAEAKRALREAGAKRVHTVALARS